MALNRDDIIGESTVQANRGVTCDSIQIAIDPVTRSLRVQFQLANVTVLADNTYYATALMPIQVDLTDGTGTKTFDIYNRRTGAKTGATRLYDLLSRDIMSLFFDTYDKAHKTQ